MDFVHFQQFLQIYERTHDAIRVLGRHISKETLNTKCTVRPASFESFTHWTLSSLSAANLWLYCENEPQFFPNPTRSVFGWFLPWKRNDVWWLHMTRTVTLVHTSQFTSCAGQEVSKVVKVYDAGKMWNMHVSSWHNLCLHRSASPHLCWIYSISSTAPIKRRVEAPGCTVYVIPHANCWQSVHRWACGQTINQSLFKAFQSYYPVIFSLFQICVCMYRYNCPSCTGTSVLGVSQTHLESCDLRVIATLWRTFVPLPLWTLSLAQAQITSLFKLLPLDLHNLSNLKRGIFL